MKDDKFKGLLQGLNQAKLLEDDEIKTKIVIRPELKDLIPQLFSEELTQLEENILREGVRDPLILWPVDDKYVLIDGHNRFAICVKHNLQFPFKKIAFNDEEEVKAWMILTQLGRRNLSPEAQSYFRGLQYRNEKGRARLVDSVGAQNGPRPEGRTAERLAEQHNVSKNTIKRDNDFSVGLEIVAESNPAIKNEILQGKSKIKMSDVQEVGRKKKSVKELFHVDEKPKQQVAKITPKSIAEIAFSFVGNETRSIEEVCSALRMDHPVEPIDFFIKWQVARNSKIGD